MLPARGIAALLPIACLSAVAAMGAPSWAGEALDLQKVVGELQGLQGLALTAQSLDERRLCLQRIVRVASRAEQIGGLRDAAAYVHWAAVRLAASEPVLRYGFSEGAAEAVLRAPRDSELPKELRNAAPGIQVYFLQIANLGEKPLATKGLRVAAEAGDASMATPALAPDDPAMPKALADLSSALTRDAIPEGGGVQGVVVFPAGTGRPQRIVVEAPEAFRVDIPFYDNKDAEGFRRAREELLMRPDPPPGKAAEPAGGAPKPGEKPAAKPEVKPDGNAPPKENPPEAPKREDEKEGILGRVQNPNFAPGYVRLQIDRDAQVRPNDRMEILREGRRVGLVLVEKIFEPSEIRGQFRYYIVKVVEGDTFKETDAVRWPGRK